MVGTPSSFLYRFLDSVQAPTSLGPGAAGGVALAVDDHGLAVGGTDAEVMAAEVPLAVEPADLRAGGLPLVQQGGEAIGPTPPGELGGQTGQAPTHVRDVEGARRRVDLFADQLGTSARGWCVGAHFDAREGSVAGKVASAGHGGDGLFEHVEPDLELHLVNAQGRDDADGRLAHGQEDQPAEKGFLGSPL